MMLGAGVSKFAPTMPALMVYAPLSSTRVLAGGGGPDDFVRRGGAILFWWVVERWVGRVDRAEVLEKLADARL